MPYVEYDEVEAACPNCGRLFRSPEALAEHRAESHGAEEVGASLATGRPVHCSHCAREFPSLSALRRHARTHGPP